MRIGFDIDGVLAEFVPTYQRLITQTSGRDLFLHGDDIDPPVWDWPALRGYGPAEISAVWKLIKASDSFWCGLGPTNHVATLALLLPALEHQHDIYFVTSRPGASAKRQTEAWLVRHLPYEYTGVRPTVLICHEKGAAAKALGLDCYIDDNRDNAIDVAVSNTATRVYVLNRAYNQGTLPRGVTRVESLAEMFNTELANL